MQQKEEMEEVGWNMPKMHMQMQQHMVGWNLQQQVGWNVQQQVIE